VHREAKASLYAGLRPLAAMERGKLAPFQERAALTALPPGCAFEPRCACAAQRLQRAVPELREVQRAVLDEC